MFIQETTGVHMSFDNGVMITHGKHPPQTLRSCVIILQICDLRLFNRDSIMTSNFIEFHRP